MTVKTAKCIGGIITYNPEINRLTQCIQKATQECQKVVVVDNGSANVGEIVQLVKKFDNSYIIENESNFGIAKALNQVFCEAAKQNYNWVLTLDQDTVIPDNLLERYSQAISNSPSNLAIICPQIHDDSSGKTWPVLNKGERERCVEKCITSASFNNVKIWDAVGGFDEKLFIDEVDHDYCYRVRKCNGMILLVDDVTINHTIGNSKIYTIFGKEIIVRNHSAFRKYYITRNILLIDRKQNGKITFLAIRHCVLFLVKTLIFEDQKKEKVAACFKGFMDGVKGV